MDLGKVKNHPGFMPFGCRNVKSDVEKKQFEKEKEKDMKDSASDSQVGK